MRGVANRSYLSFNAGEWSPELSRRIDLDKFGSASLSHQNLIPSVYGPTSRRVGTQFIGTAKYHDRACRLMDFQFSTTTTFILEAGDLYMRFYSNGGRVTEDLTITTASHASGVHTYTLASNHNLVVGDEVTISGVVSSGPGSYNGTFLVTALPAANQVSVGVSETDAGTYTSGGLLTQPYEITTVFEDTDVGKLQWTQINDVVYITHPSHPPQKLSRVTDTNWTIADVEFLIPPMLKENITTTTLTLGATTGTGQTLTASAALFDTSSPSLHIGSKWRVGHRREATEEDQVPSSTGVKGATVFVTPAKSLNFRTYGVWSGTVTIQRQNPTTAAWEAVGVFSSADDANYDVVFDEADVNGTFYRMNVTAYTSNTSGRIVLERGDYIHYALVEITAVTSATLATIDFIKDGISLAATDIWQEGAWSDYRGYPKTSTLHQLRMWYAGSSYQPQTLWGSVTDDIENFERSGLDDSGIAYTLAADQRNEIEWLLAQKFLLAGTSAGEWSIGSTVIEEPITPTNIPGGVFRQSNYGSQDIRALLVNNTVIFTQRTGKKVREMAYDITQEGFVAADVSQLASHITGDGIVDAAYQQQADSIYWAVTGQGNLIGMTYERDQAVIAWHRHTTAGSFEAVQTIYGSGDDEVWFVVNRTINGATKRFIERLNPATPAQKADHFYVDAGLTYSGASTTTISGLDHLIGEEVMILADGYKVTGKTVSATGTVTLDSAVTKAQIGLSFTWDLRPMPLDVDAQAGNSQDVVKRIRELNVNMTDSLGLTWYVGDGLGGEITKEVAFRDLTDPMDDSPPLYTGTKRFAVEGDNDVESYFGLRDSGPFPMQINGIVAKYQVTGK